MKKLREIVGRWVVRTGLYIVLGYRPSDVHVVCSPKKRKELPEPRPALGRVCMCSRCIGTRMSQPGPVAFTGHRPPPGWN